MTEEMRSWDSESCGRVRMGVEMTAEGEEMYRRWVGSMSPGQKRIGQNQTAKMQMGRKDGT